MFLLSKISFATFRMSSELIFLIILTVSDKGSMLSCEYAERVIDKSSPSPDSLLNANCPTN